MRACMCTRTHLSALFSAQFCFRNFNLLFCVLNLCDECLIWGGGRGGVCEEQKDACFKNSFIEVYTSKNSQSLQKKLRS